MCKTKKSLISATAGLLFMFNIIFSERRVGAAANDVLGCGGFIQSHVPIDYAKVEVKLVTKQGIVKDKTNCAPNNGYYFVPLYDKGEFVLQLSPPPGWSFTPKEVAINIDGTDACSLGKDINFVFDGFGIAGKVTSFGASSGGPKGVSVQLQSKEGIRKTETDEQGNFSFSPVYPGNYTVSISHPNWALHKKSLDVQVTEGNTELPTNSLMIRGYSVKGHIQTSDGYSVKNTIIILFSKEDKQTVLVENCSKNQLVGLKQKFLCHVTTNENGEFLFPVVSSGSYYVTLFFKENNIYFQPETVNFTVEHNDIVLANPFKIIGFSVGGKVVNGKSRPLSNVKIMLNGKEVATTDVSGIYKIEKVAGGTYNLKAETDDFIFDEISFDINTSTQKLPDLTPSAYKVCGKVTSDKPQTVVFKPVGSTTYLQTDTNSNQQFCQYLRRGKYEIEVKTNEENRANGLLFFPLNQIIEVESENILDLMFSQLKSEIYGQVKCIMEKDCDKLNVILKTGLDEVIIPVKDSNYILKDVHPGIYEIALEENRFCWNSNVHSVNVNSVRVEVPRFMQTGYVVNFVSSHDAKVAYTSKQGTAKEIEINRGSISVCLDASGEYIFTVKSCHTFSPDTVIYNTLSKNNAIMINAIKHTSTIYFDSDANYGPINVNVSFENAKTNKTIYYANGKYKLEVMVKPSETVTVTPVSDLLVFSPNTIQFEGTNDCEIVSEKIFVLKGKIIKGKIIPPLADVVVTVEGLPNGETLTTVTDSFGVYEFPPLDNTHTYSVAAVKDSYVITKLEDGNFKAQKLAEIVVTVSSDDAVPLSGVLLSLSGSDSYRKNLQTNNDGKISFHSLSAGDYFLRPMMKEYLFEPNSKMINVPEGKTISVQLIGKRVAFSAFGRVTTLNDEPVKDINIVASGLGNCLSFEEEAMTDTSGNFRIRGLQPHCSFKIHVQMTNKLHDSLAVERTAPNYIEVQDVTDDVRDLHFTVFHQMTVMDVMIKIYAENVDYYRSLKLKVLNENDEGNPLYTVDVENHVKSIKDKKHGILIHLPTMQADRNTYSVHLEHAYIKNKVVQVFTANSSFKYLEMNYVVKTTRSEQPIKQTSVWFVVFLVVVLIVVFKAQVILDFINDRMDVNEILASLGKFVPAPNKKKIDRNYDADIDQIVQDINNIRKRPKKTVT